MWGNAELGVIDPREPVHQHTTWLVRCRVARARNDSPIAMQSQTARLPYRYLMRDLACQALTGS